MITQDFQNENSHALLWLVYPVSRLLPCNVLSCPAFIFVFPRGLLGYLTLILMMAEGMLL